MKTKLIISLLAIVLLTSILANVGLAIYMIGESKSTQTNPIETNYNDDNEKEVADGYEESHDFIVYNGDYLTLLPRPQYIKIKFWDEHPVIEGYFQNGREEIFYSDFGTYTDEEQQTGIAKAEIRVIIGEHPSRILSYGPEKEEARMIEIGDEKYEFVFKYYHTGKVYASYVCEGEDFFEVSGYPMGPGNNTNLDQVDDDLTWYIENQIEFICGA